MYFTCSKLKTTMLVSACNDYRTAKRNSVTGVQSCNGCTTWEKETTDPANLKTQEQIHQEVLASISRPEPVRFDRVADIRRRSHMYSNN